MTESAAIDVPVIQLRPLRDRKVAKREYDRIVASIKAVGLVEPLVVFPENGDYVILDGVQRYRALVELGVEVAPCIMGKQREAFTGNRMVNRVSPVQEHRMIEKALDEVDESVIAAALGVATLDHRLKKSLLKQLHAEVASAYDAGKITRACAREFTHVKPQRQKEILRTMETYKDFSTTFARTLVVKTPAAQRENRGRKHNPWDRKTQRKNDLLKKLAEAEQKHDFYSQLYKQYTADLLRLAIYARSLVTNTRLREYLNQNHPAIVSRFETIIADARG
ncbi:MAG: ParB N-terminal domain-containing protein [Phycisphaerales bacterium]|nr:ParB N-terminal domain-containing protein [Phycisphaerales bacterium]